MMTWTGIGENRSAVRQFGCSVVLYPELPNERTAELPNAFV